MNIKYLFYLKKKVKITLQISKKYLNFYLFFYKSVYLKTKNYNLKDGWRFIFCLFICYLDGIYILFEKVNFKSSLI